MPKNEVVGFFIFASGAPNDVQGRLDFKKAEFKTKQNPSYILNRFSFCISPEVLSLFLLVGGIALKFPSLVK